MSIHENILKNGRLNNQIRLSDVKGEEDYFFCYKIMRESMEPYIKDLYGSVWPEALSKKEYISFLKESQPQKIIENDKTIGFINAKMDETNKRIIIHNFYIIPQRRGQGIGTTILTVILDIANKEGLPTDIAYFITNPAARLYARMGFVSYGEERKHTFSRKDPITLKQKMKK